MHCRQSRLGQLGAVRTMRLVALGFAFVSGLVGCSTINSNSAKPERAPAAPAAKAGATKPEIPLISGQSLQELTVREEQGQTTLLLKFAQPVNQFRHFTLPQPSRIVLDILNDTGAMAREDIFRIDTSLVSVLRVNPGETSLRVVAEIAAAAVPAYTITPENGGLKITVGNADPNVAARRSAVLLRDGKRVEVSQSGITAPRPGMSSESGTEKAELNRPGFG